MKIKVAITACLFSLAATAAYAQARSVDVARSRLAFVYTMDKTITVEGRFPRFNAEVLLDEKAPEKARIRFDIDITAIDTGSKDGDVEARMPGFFDSVKFPRATFVSTAVRRVGDRRFEADGTLSIKGQSRPVTVPFVLEGSDPSGLIAQGRFAVKRLGFGIGLGAWADTSQIADDVDVRFRFVLGPPR